MTRPVNINSENSRDKLDKTFTSLHLDELTDADKEIISRVEKIAKDCKVSMAVVATAWVIRKGYNPIVGLSSIERVDDILKATVLKLTEKDIKYLKEPYVPKQPIV